MSCSVLVSLVFVFRVVSPPIVDSLQMQVQRLVDFFKPVQLMVCPYAGSTDWERREACMVLVVRCPLRVVSMC